MVELAAGTTQQITDGNRDEWIAGLMVNADALIEAAGEKPGDRVTLGARITCATG